MSTICQKMRVKTPHWHGFLEAPCTGDWSPVRSPRDSSMVEQQTDTLPVAGSNPALANSL